MDKEDSHHRKRRVNSTNECIQGILKGSWDLVSKASSKAIIRITVLKAVINLTKTLLTKSLEPLSGAWGLSPRVQVPNNHILSNILTYVTTILKLST